MKRRQTLYEALELASPENREAIQQAIIYFKHKLAGPILCRYVENDKTKPHRRRRDPREIPVVITEEHIEAVLGAVLEEFGEAWPDEPPHALRRDLAIKECGAVDFTRAVLRRLQRR